MRLPAEIQGKNRLRDFKICLSYLDGCSPEEIKNKRTLKISVRRIQQILYECSNFVNPRIGWSKSKRLHYLQKCIAPLPSSRKDNADLIEQVRKEIEGDKPLVDNSTHNHYVIFRNPEAIREEQTTQLQAR